jgi:benzoyl-CoA reductase/2-hydroxyglutaryl-CoA dehydratase subunit BcrC/BadD/HgdB
MASIKQLKKDINNDIGAIIEDIYLWELSNPDADLSKSEKLIEEAIKVFDELVEKINSVATKENLKKQFKVVQEERNKTIKALLKKSANL